MFFNPTRDQVRLFFCQCWKKHLERLPVEPLEAQAIDLIVQHPEYHALLESPDRSRVEEFTPEQGQMNPFLHLSLHLAISEQLAIDHPPGIRQTHQRLAERFGEHEACHRALECLGEVIFAAQNGGGPLDLDAYVEKLKRLI